MNLLHAPFSARRPLIGLAFLLLAACNSPSQQALDHLRRGDVALAGGKYTQALIAYARARDLSPNEPVVQQALMRGRAYALADQPSRLAQEGVEEEKYEIQVLLETDPRHRAAYLTAMGHILAHAGDAEAAKAKFNEALKADPASALAHTALGLTLMKSKDTLAQAKTELEAAIKTDPEHVAALVAFAQIKLAEGDLAGAADKLEAALKIHDDSAGRQMLSNVRAQQNKGAEALAELQRAVQLDPKNHEALLALGQALLGAGKAEEAERPLRAAEAIRPDAPTTMALAFALMRQKKPESALGLFVRILSQDSGALPAVVGAGICSEDMGHKNDAAAFYKRALTLPADKPALKELHQDAQKRLDALMAADSASPAPSASPSASASAAASAKPSASPAAGPARK